MRILQLAQFLPPVQGGEERHVWNLSRALVARGEATARREGYDAPAGDMERWLATHPEISGTAARR